MKIKTALQATGLRKVYDYVDKDPHKRLPQIVSVIDKFVPSGSSIDGTIKGIKDALSDLMKTRADEVKESVLPLVKTKDGAYALEILSKCTQRDDRVYDALLTAFRTAEEEDVPLYAGYLASYGDDRALPYLAEHIRCSDIDFVTFQELKFAIEALGGEYNEQRDFSDDESYKKIMAAGAGTDIFGSKRG